MATRKRPVLSVVVTIVDGGEVLRRFLRALTQQQNPPEMEILVPYDVSISETSDLRREFPEPQFIAMGALQTERPIHSAAGQHELYDRRRAAGLSAAQGELTAILEDRAPPRPNWACTVARLHEQPYGVIGGAIECASRDTLNWAFYVCDFGRYGLPFQSGPRQWVSDINVSYKRKMLDDTRAIWAVRFSEPLVHWALLERGEELYLSSEMVVDYRTDFQALGSVLPQRFHWGRLFGAVRAKKLSALGRAAHIVLGPLILPVLFVRHGIAQAQKGNFLRFLRAAPTMAMLLTSWSAGEVWGTITKKS